MIATIYPRLQAIFVVAAACVVAALVAESSLGLLGLSAALSQRASRTLLWREGPAPSSGTQCDPVIVSRLQERGAAVEGELRVTLAWGLALQEGRSATGARNDLDLAVEYCQDGKCVERIDAYQRTGGVTQGRMDADSNYTHLTLEGEWRYANGQRIGRENIGPWDGKEFAPGFGRQTSEPVENIIFPKAPPGHYRILVSHFWNRDRSVKTPYRLEIALRGRVLHINGAMDFLNVVEDGPAFERPKPVYEFDVEEAPADYLVCDAAGHLARIDLYSGQVSVLGTMPTTMDDMAFTGDGRLYGVSAASPAQGSDLYRIDPRTGRAERLGSTGAALNALCAGPRGSLWAAGGTGVYRVRTATGRAHLLVSIAPQVSAGDLAYDRQGRLCLTTLDGGLLQVDPERRTVTRIGTPGIPLPYGLLTASDGHLYGFSNVNSNVWVLDDSTGAGHPVRSLNGDSLAGIHGAAARLESRFAPRQAAPGPDVWPLIAMAWWTGLLGLALVRSLYFASNRFWPEARTGLSGWGIALAGILGQGMFVGLLTLHVGVFLARLLGLTAWGWGVGRLVSSRVPPGFRRTLAGPVGAGAGAVAAVIFEGLGGGLTARLATAAILGAALATLLIFQAVPRLNPFRRERVTRRVHLPAWEVDEWGAE